MLHDESICALARMQIAARNECYAILQWTPNDVRAFRVLRAMIDRHSDRLMAFGADANSVNVAAQIVANVSELERHAEYLRNRAAALRA
jgi:hypothetical protein